ncbi:MAG: UTRA domain-containing protein [Cytophagales bacterium]|nr:UTRA domain-containing protein [Cytophagales bacterium]
MDEDLTDRSLFHVLRSQYGLEVKGGEQKLWAMPAPRSMAEYLQVPLHTPLLHLKRVLETTKPGLRVYSIIYCNTEEFYLLDSF